jgi:hydroxymethylbilane synthase
LSVETPSRPVVIATRGSALALAQANLILASCRAAFPGRSFELKIIKTTGDKLQTISLANPNQQMTKGLFTKELEVALLDGEADLAVHSLKDLPTELPEGLHLAAVTERADVRDVLIYRDAERLRKLQAAVSADCPPPERKLGLSPHALLPAFPPGSTLATSSTRRQAQLLALRPDLSIVPIRGNVGTRLRKLSDQAQLDGLILASAGLHRLGMQISPDGRLVGEEVPEGILATFLSTEEMLPCVGQGALGIETAIGNKSVEAICRHLNESGTQCCVTGERAFLRAMGGGCLSPVAAYGELQDGRLRLRAVSFRDERPRRGELRGEPEMAEEMGRQLARELSS